MVGLLGDPSETRRLLAWAPCAGFWSLVHEMVATNPESAMRIDLPRNEGFVVRERREQAPAQLSTPRAY